MPKSHLPIRGFCLKNGESHDTLSIIARNISRQVPVYRCKSSVLVSLLTYLDGAGLIRSIRSHRLSFTSWPKSWAVCSFLIELALVTPRVYLSGGENWPQSRICSWTRKCALLSHHSIQSLNAFKNRTLAQVESIHTFPLHPLLQPDLT